MSEKKRKLKPPLKRRSEKRLLKSDHIQMVVDRTGFRKEDILQVIKEYFDIAEEQIKDKGLVLLPNLGMLQAYIRPSRQGVALYGGQKPPKKIVVPPLWKVKFIVNQKFDKDMREIKVTKQEEDSIYEDL